MEQNLRKALVYVRMCTLKEKIKADKFTVNGVEKVKREKEHHGGREAKFYLRLKTFSKTNVQKEAISVTKKTSTVKRIIVPPVNAET